MFNIKVESPMVKGDDGLLYHQLALDYSISTSMASNIKDNGTVLLKVTCDQNTLDAIQADTTYNVVEVVDVG